MEHVGSLRIEQRHLQCFAGTDKVFLRDPRGKSSTPSLLYDDSTPLPVIVAQGPFQLRYNYTVSREQGVRFCDVTGDPNPIHRDTDIVAGALTASKVIAPFEVLCPALQIRSVQMKFRGFCRYGRTIRSVFRCVPGADGTVSIQVKAHQDDVEVAIARAVGHVLEGAPHTPVREKRVNPAGLTAVKGYFASLGIDSQGYFDKGDFADYTYPFGYVLSLPTGEIVRQMSGQGGMLNVLRLQTIDSAKIPITGSDLPAVRLKRLRPKRTFNRILTDVIQGVITYYKGSVIVNPSVDIAAF